MIDDITWDDLDMDEVFPMIDRTGSSLGEEILHASLRTPLFSSQELDAMEERLSGYAADEAGLKESIPSLKKLGKLKKITLFDYLYYLDRVEDIPYGKLFLPLILMLLAVSTLNLHVTAGVLLIVLVYGINTVRYFRLAAKIKPYLISFAYLSKAIKLGRSIPFADQDKVKRLLPVTRGTFILGSLEGETASGGTGNPLDLLFDLLKMGFHFDILKFYSMLGFVRKNFDEIEGYLYELGRIDTDLSVLMLRRELKEQKKQYCIPVLTNEKKLSIKESVHPLLKAPVPNSIETGKSILLTGSNASGKSTFLKCIAINALFAQTIHTCFAESYEGGFFRVISSMSHRDDILKGESYYMVEIRAMKRILTELNDKNDDNGSAVLCFIDEILSGTNTKERIAAGSRILKYLSDGGALAFAATHDIELTVLLENDYRNYHFEEDVTGNDISFSYKLKEGRAVSRNAIKLLSLMDFPESIVAEAEALADKL